MNSAPKKPPEAKPFKPQLKRVVAPAHQVNIQAIQTKKVAAAQNANVRPSAVSRTQINPHSGQPKTVLTPPSRTPPAAPPVYRPQQQIPRVAQMKTIQGQPPAAAGQTRRTLVAPPVYRPQPQKIVQSKVAGQTQRPSVNQVYRPLKPPVVNSPRPAPPLSKNAAPVHKMPSPPAVRQGFVSRPAHVIQRSSDGVSNLTEYIQTKDSNCWAACLSYAIKLKHKIDVNQKTITNWLPQDYSQQGLDLYGDTDAINLINKKLEQETKGLGQAVSIGTGERFEATSRTHTNLETGFTIRTPVSQAQLLTSALERYGILIVHVFGIHFVVVHNYDSGGKKLTVYDPNIMKVDELSVADFCKNYKPNYGVTV